MTKGSKSPEAKQAYKLVWQALKNGTLRPAPCCERCGMVPRERKYIHAHHDNYYLPLAVRWLCSKCHMQWHKAEAKLIREFYSLSEQRSNPIPIPTGSTTGPMPKARNNIDSLFLQSPHLTGVKQIQFGAAPAHSNEDP